VQFDLLQVELRTGKAVKIADMVVVHMCEHDVLDGVAVDADQSQRLDRAAQKAPLRAAATSAVNPVSMMAV
jgi:hypothetical protein